MMMKILGIEERYADAKPQGKSYTVYSCRCLVDLGSGSEQVRVVTFTDKIKVNTGDVFEAGKNVKEIRIETKEWQGMKYKQVTLSPIQSGFQSRQLKPQMTISEYQTKVSLAHDMAKMMTGKDAEPQLVWSYFSAILKGMENVSVSGDDIQKRAEDKIEKTFSSPFDDSSIPA